MSHQPHNVYAGTQVVSLVEVRGTNNSLVHQRGAVGVVTRTPTGDQKHFLVRFPDGFEASLTRDDVIRHCSRHLEDFMVPRLVEFRKTLPKSENGKISRRQIAEAELAVLA